MVGKLVELENWLCSVLSLSCHTGGEKGVPLRLHLEMRQCECGMNSGCGHRCECPVVYQGACSVKVFKDKGGDRKQRQDQSKIEKLPPSEQVGTN